MDAPPTVDQLLAHAGWVKALARRIVADSHDAEEIAQETLLRALERPPRSGESAARLRSWLARVASRFALQRWRRDDAARRREQASATLPRPAGEPPRDVALVVAHAELHRRVVEAVLALAEPYRATLLLRFFEDESPPRIAERTEVPLATVHTRLRRGVEQLRAKFATERGDGGELRAWLAAEPVLAVGVAARTLIAAAAVLLFAWGGWELSRASDGSRGVGIAPIAAAIDEADSEQRSAATGETVVADRQLDAVAGGALLPHDVAAIQELVFDGTATLLGRVVDEEGNPVAGARCELRLSGDGQQLVHYDVVADELVAHGFASDAAPPPRRVAPTNANGDFRIAGFRHGIPHRLLVTADRFMPEVRYVPGNGRSLDFGADARSKLRLPTIVMKRGAALIAVVVDAAGAPVAGAEVYTVRQNSGPLRAWLSPASRDAVSDREGRATIVLDGPGDFALAARAPDGRVAFARAVEGGGPIELRLHDGADFRVTVRLADGTPLPGIEVQISVKLGEECGDFGQPRFTDQDGVATFPLLPRGARSIHLIAPGGTLRLFGDEASREVVASDNAADFVVALSALPIAVRFVDASDGSPVAASRLLVVDAELGERESSWPPGWSGVATRGLGVLTPDGRTGTLLLAPPQDRPRRVDSPWNDRPMQDERFRVVVDAIGRAETWLGPFEPAKLPRGEPLVLPIERGTTATLVVRDGSGNPLRDARAHVVGAGAVIASSTYEHHVAGTLRAARADAAGRIEIGPLASGPHRITVEAPGFVTRAIDVAFAQTPGEPLVVELDRGARLVATVTLDSDELPDQFAVVLRPADQHERLVAGLDDDGVATFDGLAPGHYDVLAFEVDPRQGPDLQSAGLASKAPGAFTRIDLAAGDASIALSPRRLDRSTLRLDVAVADPARPGVSRAMLRCVTESGERVALSLAIEGGRVAADLPVAKSYLLTMAEELPLPGRATDETQSWIVAERAFNAEGLRRGLPPIEVARGHVRVTLLDASGAPWQQATRLVATRTAGSDFAADFSDLNFGQTRVYATTAEPIRDLADLPAGRIWLRNDSNDLAGEAVFDVPTDATIDVTITLRKRSR